MDIKVRKIDEELLEKLSKELNLDKIILTLLINRGYDTVEKINEFLYFNNNNLKNINKLKDVDKFMNILISSIKAKEEITIYGDYDCDGIMATYIWVSALRRLNIRTNYFVNNRFNEGYGMNVKGVDRLLRKYPNTKLIITCDNGIAAKEGVEYCMVKNLKLFVKEDWMKKKPLSSTLQGQNSPVA